jgi:hypothetical protein
MEKLESRLCMTDYPFYSKLTLSTRGKARLKNPATMQ